MLNQSLLLLTTLACLTTVIRIKVYNFAFRMQTRCFDGPYAALLTTAACRKIPQPSRKKPQKHRTKNLILQCLALSGTVIANARNHTQQPIGNFDFQRR